MARCALVLDVVRTICGGRTPAPLYVALGQSPHREAVDWTHAEIFYGDERPVFRDNPHPDRAADDERDHLPKGVRNSTSGRNERALTNSRLALSTPSCPCSRTPPFALLPFHTFALSCFRDSLSS